MTVPLRGDMQHDTSGGGALQHDTSGGDMQHDTSRGGARASLAASPGPLWQPGLLWRPGIARASLAASPGPLWRPDPVWRRHHQTLMSRSAAQRSSRSHVSAQRTGRSGVSRRRPALWPRRPALRPPLTHVTLHKHTYTITPRLHYTYTTLLLPCTITPAHIHEYSPATYPRTHSYSLCNMAQTHQLLTLLRMQLSATFLLRMQTNRQSNTTGSVVKWRPW